MSKTILITGAGSGMGRLAAIELARRGHDVIATVERPEQVDELSGAHPELTVAKLDITDADDVATLDQWDIDVLINNAGFSRIGPISRMPMELIRRTFEINVFGTVAVTQRVVARMKERGSGRVLIVSSVAGLRAGPYSSPYSMSKHALQAFGAALRGELAPLGIDVALINPGPFATGFNDAMFDTLQEWWDRDTAPPHEVELFDGLRQRITVGQLDPDDAAKVYADLAEAETTELINPIPADILQQFADHAPR